MEKQRDFIAPGVGLGMTGYKTWACTITVCTCLMMGPMVEDLFKLFLFIINPFHQVLQNRLTVCETEVF